MRIVYADLGLPADPSKMAATADWILVALVGILLLIEVSKMVHPAEHPEHPFEFHEPHHPDKCPCKTELAQIEIVLKQIRAILRQILALQEHPLPIQHGWQIALLDILNHLLRFEPPLAIDDLFFADRFYFVPDCEHVHDMSQ